MENKNNLNQKNSFIQKCIEFFNPKSLNLALLIQLLSLGLSIYILSFYDIYFSYVDSKKALENPFLYISVLLILNVLFTISYILKKEKKEAVKKYFKSLIQERFYKSNIGMFLLYTFLAFNLVIWVYVFLLAKTNIFAVKNHKEYTSEEINRIALHEAAHCVINEIEFPNTTNEIRIFSKNDYKNVEIYLSPDAQHLPKGVTRFKREDIIFKEQILKSMRVSLAGLAAETILSKDKEPGAGSSSDLEKVKKGVIAIVNNGLTAFGPIQWDILTESEQKQIYIGIVGMQYATTKELIRQNKDVIENLAKQLVEKKILNKNEIKKIIMSK